MAMMATAVPPENAGSKTRSVDRVAIGMLILLILGAYANIVVGGKSLIPSEHINPLDPQVTELSRGQDFSVSFSPRQGESPPDSSSGPHMRFPRIPRFVHPLNASGDAGHRRSALPRRGASLTIDEIDPRLKQPR